MQIAKIDSIDRGWEEILLYVRRADTSLGPDFEGPAVRSAALIDDSALPRAHRLR